MAVELRTTDASETFAALLGAVMALSEALDAELDEEAGMPLRRYSVLLTLARAPEGAMRPSELADVLPLTRSGTTRLVDRLEADGLVERSTCSSDRRGNWIALTAEGEEIFRRAGRIHLRGLDQHIGSHLSCDEMGELRRLLDKLVAGVSPTGSV